MFWRRRRAERELRDVARVRVERGDVVVVRYMDGTVDVRDLERLGRSLRARGAEVVLVPVSGQPDELLQLAVLGPAVPVELLAATRDITEFP